MTPGRLPVSLPLLPLPQLSPSRYASLKACALREVWTAARVPSLPPANPGSILFFEVYRDIEAFLRHVNGLVYTGFVKQHGGLFLTWGTIFPLGVSLGLLLVQLLARRLVWPSADEFTVADLLRVRQFLAILLQLRRRHRAHVDGAADQAVARRAGVRATGEGRRPHQREEFVDTLVVLVVAGLRVAHPPSEGGAAPLPNLPPSHGAGEAGARSAMRLTHTATPDTG